MVHCLPGDRFGSRVPDCPKWEAFPNQERATTGGTDHEWSFRCQSSQPGKARLRSGGYAIQCAIGCSSEHHQPCRGYSFSRPATRERGFGFFRVWFLVTKIHGCTNRRGQSVVGGRRCGVGESASGSIVDPDQEQSETRIGVVCALEDTECVAC